MWRALAFAVLLAAWVAVVVVIGVPKASASEIEIIEVKTPRMCEYQGVEISCSFLIALASQVSGYDFFCTLHSCPKEL